MEGNWYVYIMCEEPISESDCRPYKIGCAKWPHKRRRSLQAGNPRRLKSEAYIGPYGTEKNAKLKEAQLQSIFKEHNVRGDCEWFMVNPLGHRRFYDWVATEIEEQRVEFVPPQKREYYKRLLRSSQRRPLTEAPSGNRIVRRRSTSQRKVSVRWKRRKRLPPRG